MTRSEIKQGYCTLCRSRCGTLNEVRDDMLVAVRPDPSHPTGAAMCMKGRAAPELVHSPHRVHHPMRRTRPKGDADPGWVRISWEEALSEIAKKLEDIRQRDGAEAVAFAVTTPSGTPLSDSIDWIERFIRIFGSPNTCFATEICNWHKDVAHAFTFGCGMPVADYSRADLIVLWGHNPTNTWLAQANAIAEGRARGAKLIVVDPRPTSLALQADVWLPVKPGTDAALALGIMHLLIEQDAFDVAFTKAWTNGPFLVRGDNGMFLREQDLWPEAASNRHMVIREGALEATPYDRDLDEAAQDAGVLRLRGDIQLRLPRDGVLTSLNCMPAFEMLARGSASYSPEAVREIAGVSPDALRSAATLFAQSSRVAYHSWTGIGQHTNATQSERAVASLYALTGSFDRVGGNRVRRGPLARPVNALSLLPAAQRAKALGLKERPIGPPAHGWITARDMYKAILEGEPYKVRGLMAFGTNIVVSQADADQAHQALMALEFHVHCDLFETPASRYADIFLPVNTPWEREGLRIGFEINDRAAATVQLRQQMVSARGESRSDNDIVFDLARRLGMGAEFFEGNLEAGWNYMLEPLGTSVAELRKRPEGMQFPIDARERKYALPDAGDSPRPRGFATETGRIELYSELLLRHGQPAIASFLQPAEIAAADGDYPLVLSSAKNGYYCHSQHRSLVSLRKRAPDPVVEMSHATASRRGILDGDWVRIVTRVGKARFVARLTAEMSDEVVFAEFGWWQSCTEIDRAALPEDGPANSNFNGLVSADHADPVSGSVPLRSFRCEVMPDPSFEPRQRKWEGFRRFSIRALTAEAEGVIGIHFESLDGAGLPDYRPGQHVETRFDIGGSTISRAYSLTGAASVPNRTGYSVAVRHQRGLNPEGVAYEGFVSSHLHRELRVGDLVELRAPSGSFVVPRHSAQPLVLVAGGIGITPFISLLESLPDGHEADIRLFYANQNSRTHAFRSRIAFHQSRLPGLRVVNHYRRPTPDDRMGVDYDSAERMGADDIDDSLIARRARVYMCGPPAMMEAVRDRLVERGMPRFDIFSEVFRSPPRLVLDGAREFKVVFARSAKPQATWSPRDGTLLSFGEAMGLRLASGCRVGQCESCATTVLAGKVRHLHGVEPEDPTVCLTCQAIPTEDLVLDA